MGSAGKLKSDAVLLLAASIWGFAFVAQRVGMDFIGPFTFSAIRFGLGCLVLVPFLFFRKHLAFNRLNPSKPQRRGIIRLQLLLGVLVFGGVSFQQVGLVYTTAGNAGFITGLYVVFVPVAGLFLGQKNRTVIWIGVVLALTGLYFLSVKENLSINFGDYLVFVCAIFWTIHVLVVGHVAPRTDPIRTAIIQFAICSILSWIVAIAVEEISLGPVLDALWPILYGGVLSVGIGYTLQVVAQQKAHPAYASIILSMESVFAILGGWLLLGEALTWKILLGCGLMLSGMIVAQVKGFTGVSSAE